MVSACQGILDKPKPKKEHITSELLKALVTSKISRFLFLFRNWGHVVDLNEWMNEWMCIYIPHISAHIVSTRFTILIEWDRTSACKGASGCRYRFIFDLTRPPNPCMKCAMKLQIDHHTGNYVPYSFRLMSLRVMLTFSVSVSYAQ